MKIVLFFATIFLSISAKAQFDLGYSEDTIRKKNSELKWETQLKDHNIKLLTCILGNDRLIYFFDEKTTLSVYSMITPKDSRRMNEIVGLYNRSFVTNSKTSWTRYLNNGNIVKISLEFDKDDKTWYFEYHL